MENNSSIDKIKKRLKIYYSLLLTVICIIGVSFAWFRLYLSQGEDNTLASRTCFNTTLTEDTSKIALTDAFPISDADGLKQTPFTFTLKNNCNDFVKVYITIDSTHRESPDEVYLKDSHVKVNVSPKDTTSNSSKILGSLTLTDLENNEKGYIIINDNLKANEEKSYDLRIWMDSATTLEQGLDKTWAGKIVVVTRAANTEKSLRETILANNKIETPLTVPGREVSAHTLDDINDIFTEEVSSTYQAYYVTYGTGCTANGTGFDLTGASVTSDTYANSYSSLIGKYLPDISFNYAGSSTAGTKKTTTNLSQIYYVTSATATSFTYKILSSNKQTTEALMASTADDYGTSYYFRGTVKNNYVQFANKCWRIVRITGDGSIKLVLHNDNTSGKSNPCSSSNNSFTAAFANYNGETYKSTFNSSYKDNAYIGFMYGEVGASDYTSTHANINKSTILTNLETWYENNLIPYTDELADTIWCNDKSTFSVWTSGTTYYTGLGYGSNRTGYGTYNRIYGGNAKLYAAPSLICPNDNNGGKLSKFTVNDTTNGNGNLDYKIGLLTADEIAYAGSIYREFNDALYLQENTGTTSWWSMAPFEADTSSGYRITRWPSGTLLARKPDISSGLRPSIALKSDITISGGTGTSEDPYVVN